MAKIEKFDLDKLNRDPDVRDSSQLEAEVRDFRNCLKNRRNVMAIFPISSVEEQQQGLYGLSIVHVRDNSNECDDEMDFLISICDNCLQYPESHAIVRTMAKKLNTVLKMVEDQKAKQR